MLKILLKNASFNTLGQVVSLILGFLVVPFYISYLSIAGYGVYCFINSFLQWITILQMGLEPTVISLTAKYFAQKQYDEINNMVTMASIFQVVVGVLLACIIWSCSDLILNIILKNRTDYLIEGRTALHWASINIIFIMCTNIYFAALNGLQRYDISSTMIMLTNLCSTVTAVLFVWQGDGIVGIIKARFIFSLFFLLLSMVLLRKTLKCFRFDFRFKRSLLKEIVKFGSWIVVGRINRLGINMLPPLLIGNIIGPTGIAYYNIAQKIIVTLNNFLSSAVTVIFPMVSQLNSLKKNNKIQSIYLTANKYLSLFSVPLYCFVGLFSWTILNIWVGKEIADSCWLLTSIMSIGYYLSSSTMIPSSFALGLGNSRVLAINGFIQLIVIILTLPVLVKKFGIIGAGINLVLFETVSFGTGIYITTKLVNVSAVQFWLKDRCFHYLLGLMTFSLPILLNKWSPVNTAGLYGLFHLGLYFMIGFTVYGISALGLGVIEPEVKLHMKKVFIRGTN